MCEAAAQRLISIPPVTRTNLRHTVLGARVRFHCEETVPSLMLSPSLHFSSRFPRFFRLIYSLVDCFCPSSSLPVLPMCTLTLYRGCKKKVPSLSCNLKVVYNIWQDCQALSVGLNRLKTKQLEMRQNERFSVFFPSFLSSFFLSSFLSLSCFLFFIPPASFLSFTLSSFLPPFFPLLKITAETERSHFYALHIQFFLFLTII